MDNQGLLTEYIQFYLETNFPDYDERFHKLIEIADSPGQYNTLPTAPLYTETFEEHEGTTIMTLNIPEAENHKQVVKLLIDDLKTLNPDIESQHHHYGQAYGTNYKPDRHPTIINTEQGENIIKLTFKDHITN